VSGRVLRLPGCRVASVGVTVACRANVTVKYAAWRRADRGFGRRIAVLGGGCPTSGSATAPTPGAACSIAISAHSGSTGGAVYTMQLTSTLTSIVSTSVKRIAPSNIVAGDLFGRGMDWVGDVNGTSRRSTRV
jgi:hypothetical protein